MGLKCELSSNKLDGFSNLRAVGIKKENETAKPSPLPCYTSAKTK
jgi:hypothetical protein